MIDMTRVYNKVGIKEIRLKLRKVQTEAEGILWDCIRNNKLGVRFKRQYSVDNFVLDFYAPSIKLAIEVDGDYHNKKDVIEYDLMREEFISNTGIKFLRFSNNEIFNDIVNVVNKIKQNIKQDFL